MTDLADRDERLFRAIDQYCGTARAGWSRRERRHTRKHRRWWRMFSSR